MEQDQPKGCEVWRQRQEEMERGLREQRQEMQRMREEHAEEMARVKRGFEIELEELRRAAHNQPERQASVLEVAGPCPPEAPSQSASGEMDVDGEREGTWDDGADKDKVQIVEGKTATGNHSFPVNSGSLDGEEFGDCAGHEKIKFLEKLLLEKESSVKEAENKVDSLQAENAELKRTFVKSRQIFGKQYREFERMQKMLVNLQKEEEELGVVEKKIALCKINRESMRKEAIVRRLKERIDSKRKIMAASKQSESEISLKTTGQDPALIVPVWMTKATPKIRRRGLRIAGEGLDAAEVFPEEVWEIILGHVQDPLDRWSCYNACPLFKRILHQWKTTWLFEKALPYLFPDLPEVKLVACREVSKGWRETVDQFIQNHPSLRPHNEDTHDSRTLSFVSPRVSGRKAEFYFGGHISFEINLDDPEYLATTQQMLIAERAAHVTIDCTFSWQRQNRIENEGDMQLWRNVRAFFHTFGEHIWYLKLNFLYSTMDFHLGRLARFLNEDLFQLAPNLRSLSLSSDGPPHMGEIGIGIAVEPELLPSMPNLETLEVAYGTAENFRSFLLIFLAKYHMQLGKVVLETEMWDEVCHFRWSNLTELLLDTPRHMDTLERLLREGGAMPKLTKLGLGFSTLDSDNNDLAQFLEILENLSKTTRLSTLRLVDGVHHNVLRQPRGRLSPVSAPGLKTLELDYCGATMTIPHPSFQFLLYFPHLENLHVFWNSLQRTGGEISPLPDHRHRLGRRQNLPLWNDDLLDYVNEFLFNDPNNDDDEMEVSDYEDSTINGHKRERTQEEEEELLEVNRYLYSGGMYKSNIWKLLPRLKVFTFQWKVYTRGGYEDYCRRSKSWGKDGE